jgi:phosphoribosylcarboxyaminoimidazole (NCAIR) mutase
MKNLKHNLAAILIGISSFSALAQGSTGTLKGQILNSDHEPVIGATIKILQGGSLIGGTAQMPMGCIPISL